VYTNLSTQNLIQVIGNQGLSFTEQNSLLIKSYGRR